MVEHQYQQLKILEKQSMPKEIKVAAVASSTHRRLHSQYEPKTF
jgi:hypothetical protein